MVSTRPGYCSLAVDVGDIPPAGIAVAFHSEHWRKRGCACGFCFSIEEAAAVEWVSRLDPAAPIRARAGCSCYPVHVPASRFRTQVEMPQEGTCEPLWRAADPEAFRERNARGPLSGSVEAVSLFLHEQFLRAFVGRGMSVLEVGAGAGRFTQALAEISCRVVVADPSAVQLEGHREWTVAMGCEHAVVGRLHLDTRDLSPICQGSFDGVVCFGGACDDGLAGAEPTLAELARVCRPGGGLLLSVLSLAGAVQLYLRGGLRIPTDKQPGATVSEHRCPKNWAEVRYRCQMFRAEELYRAAQKAGVEVVTMSASNVLSLGWEPFLPGSGGDPERLEELLRLELLACREEGSLDMGTRIILAGRKG